MNVMRLLLKRYERKINKVIKGGSILSILFSLIISLLIPPFNIHADDYSSSTIIGYQIVYDDVEYINQAWKYSYHLHFTLDDSYVGYIYMSYDITYAYNISGGVQNNQIFSSPNKAYYVNGNTLDLYFYFKTFIDYQASAISPIVSNGVSYTVGNHNLTKHSMITTIEQIYDILEDCYYSVDQLEGINNNQLTELQNVVSSIGLSNQYLEILTQMRQWNFPIESYQAVMYMLSNNYELLNFHEFDYYTFPIFKVNNGDVINRAYINNGSRYIYICATNNNVTASTLSNFFSVDYGTVENFRSLGRFSYGNTVNCYMLSFEVYNNSGTNRNIKLSYIGADDKFIMPIYFRTNNSKAISTDFALQFGLTNDLLENLNIIANGTQQSNQSSSDLNNQTSSFDTTSSDLYTSENAFNTDMNSKLQSIDTSFDPSTSFGSKFLSSANWVRTQFDNITSTTPFGTVLSFSMLLGLSLLIIGKVFK